MYKKLLLLVLCFFLFTSCAPIATLEPTETPTATPTKAYTSTASSTNTPVSTKTVTPVFIPPYMKAFLDGGYDKMSNNDVLYYVKDKKSYKIVSGAPISIGSLLITSWITNVAYFDNNGVFHQDGIILDGICRMENGQSVKDTLLESSQVNNGPFCPLPAYYQSLRTQINLKTIGDFHIMKGLLGTGHDDQKDFLFTGIFPLKDGQWQPVYITGIGKVLPVTQSSYVDDVFKK